MKTPNFEGGQSETLTRISSVVKVTSGDLTVEMEEGTKRRKVVGNDRSGVE